MNSHNALQRFTDRVADYARHRPTYPDALYDCLRERFALRPDASIADIGSGTGISSALFLRRGHRVIAVEPNAAMRSAAEAALRDAPGFSSVEGRAEATGLPDASVDWIVAAQAFHWFEPQATRTEWRRILKSAGAGDCVALLWNDRRVDTPFLQGYECFLKTFATDYERVNHVNVSQPDVLARFFGAMPQAHAFDNAQTLDFDSLRGRVGSSSYMPCPAHAAYPQMIEALQHLFDAHADARGRVTLHYDARLFVGGLPLTENR